MQRIGMIGGGAAAACMVEALSVDADLAASDLTIFEPSETLWTGRPFGSDLDSVLVNSRAEDMSLRAHDPTHFRCWLDNQSISDEFVPRSVYGRYLRECATDGIHKLRSRGWNVNIVKQAACEAFRVGGELMLCGYDGIYGPFGTLIIAAGGNPPQDAHLPDVSDRLIPDPYPLRETLRSIEPTDTVAVLGTGLTAVDTVLALQHIGHSGSIFMVSRSGLLPAVRDLAFEYKPCLLSVHGGAIDDLQAPVTSARLRQLVSEELMLSGLTLADVEIEILSATYEPARDRLLRQIAACSREAISALGILQRTIPAIGPKLWPVLDDDLRSTFLAEYQRIFLSLCCPMPQLNARKIAALLNSGQLTVLTGLLTVKQTDVAVEIQTIDKSFNANHVVNATSAPSDKIPRSAGRLIRSLVKEGLAAKHPLGGLCVQPDSSLCNGLRTGPASSHNPRVYAIGDIAAGTFYFTFGISSIVDRCQDVCADISATESIAKNRHGSEINA